MKFDEIFYEQDCCDVLLIQPNMLQQVSPKYIDPVQTEYWDSLSHVGSLFGDLPIEPNWGLLYIASSLKANNYKVSLLDFHLYDYVKFQKTGCFIDIKDIKNILSLKSFKVVGISSMTLCHDKALEIAKICKEVNPQCTVILGGIHFSFVYEETLKQHQYVDAIIIGEGEYTFLDIMKNLDNKKSWSDIKGLAYHYKNGLFINAEYGQIQDIYALKYPDYDLWPSDVPLIPRIYTTRGCNGGCSYCIVNKFFGSTYRTRDTDKVVDELEYLVNKYNFKDVLVGDLNFAVSKAHAINFCKQLIERNIKVQWWCQMRPDAVDEELVSLMAKAGCVQIGIGIESAEDDILDGSASSKIKKGTTVEDVCKLIQKYNIETQGYFILGLPGESIRTAIKTIELINHLTKEGYVDVSHISVMVPYPGSPIFNQEDCFDVEIADRDFSKFLMNCDYMNSGVPVVNTSNLSRYQIYSLWQLALSTASNNFRRRYDVNKPVMFTELSSFSKNIEFLDFERGMSYECS